MYILNFSKEHMIENLNQKDHLTVSQQLSDKIETYETVNIIFNNQRKNKFIKLNGNEYTNSFILNFGCSIPMDIWNSEYFQNNIIQKLPLRKTYLLETNNAGTKGIPVGIIGERKGRNNMILRKFQLNDISAPLSIHKIREKFSKGKLNKYIKNNLDFESKRHFEIDGGNKLNDVFVDGNTISQELLKHSQNKFFDSVWHGQYLQFNWNSCTYPCYIFNSNLIQG